MANAVRSRSWRGAVLATAGPPEIVAPSTENGNVALVTMSAISYGVSGYYIQYYRHAIVCHTPSRTRRDGGRGVKAGRSTRAVQEETALAARERVHRATSGRQLHAAPLDVRKRVRDGTRKHVLDEAHGGLRGKLEWAHAVHAARKDDVA